MLSGLAYTLAGAATLAMLLNCLTPSIARVNRVYYKGQDQFYWAARFDSNDPAIWSEAASALEIMLKKSRGGVRIWMIQEFELNPKKATSALSTLQEVADDEQEEEWIRDHARNASRLIIEAAKGDTPIVPGVPSPR